MTFWNFKRLKLSTNHEIEVMMCASYYTGNVPLQEKCYSEVKYALKHCPMADILLSFVHKIINNKKHFM